MPEIIQDLYRPSRNFTDRQKRFLDLIPVVECCHACPAMEGRRRVLSTKNGNAKAKIMFVAEAPGRNGADRTGVPIHGDPTGVNFEKLLASVGLERSEVFVTNAVLCNPRDDRGNNRPPSPAELTNCSIHLESTIRIIEPGVIAPLGANAL
jgi:uracil-DNA glycosylase family 4